MSRLRRYFRVAVRCVAKLGIKGLMEEVPGGKYLYAFGEQFAAELRAEGDQTGVRAFVEEAVAASFDQALADARVAVPEVLAEAGVEATPAETVALELWLAGVPEATRQSLKRKDDPTGTSLPFGFTIDTAEDAARLFPGRPPRLAPGAALAGLPGWAVDRLLGVGGFGEVWLARKGKLSNLTGAVKFGDVGREAELIDRVMAAGTHDHIVRLVNADTDADGPWLMYEYVPGGTLTDYVHVLQTLDPADRHRRAADVLAQLADAAEFFHTLPDPVVHRDLKPSNALLDRSRVRKGGDPADPGRVRVTDLGIGAVAARHALLLDARGQTTAAGRRQTYLRGSHTPLYASEQQKRGDAPDPRDDVHALGVIGYQLYTGRLDAAPGSDIADDLREAGATDGMIGLLAACVARNPARRPKDGADLAARLKALASGGRQAPDPGASGASGGREPPDAGWDQGAHAPRSPEPPPVHVAPPARKGGDELLFPLPYGLKMAFCWVPPGTCQLGSPLAEQNAVIEAVGSRPDWLAAESQAKRGTFTTTGFWLAKYPVTQAEWHALTGESPSHFQPGGGGAADVKGLDTTRFPVENVSWDMCQQDFLPKLNALGATAAVFGKGVGAFRLPHEDEWEYAARGGHADGRPFYWGKELNGHHANHDGNYPFGTAAKGPYLKRPTPVGTYAAKAPHPWGLCDLLGNVWEWCDNWYDSEQKYRVLRGGSWISYGHGCRAAYRARNTPDARSSYFGLRVLLPLD